jgi:hypothetical protein
MPDRPALDAGGAEGRDIDKASPATGAYDGSPWIVKLAKMDDAYAVARAEVMALRLAGRVGISVAEADVLTSGQRFPVGIVKRFDREGQGTRIPFISAQNFMGLTGTEPGNYVGVAFQMHAWSRNPATDMRELYRRLLFNILIQNTDDHLHNLGFLVGVSIRPGAACYATSTTTDSRRSSTVRDSERQMTRHQLLSHVFAAPSPSSRRAQGIDDGRRGTPRLSSDRDYVVGYELGRRLTRSPAPVMPVRAPEPTGRR